MICHRHTNQIGRCAATNNWKDFADRKVTLDQITPEDIQSVAADIFQDTHDCDSCDSNQEAFGTNDIHKYDGCSNISGTSHSHIPKMDNQEGWQIQSISPTTNILHVPSAMYVRATLSARFSPEQHDIATIMTSSMGKGSMPSGISTTNALMALHTERYFRHDKEYIHMTMELPLSKSLQKASNIMFENEWKNPTFSESVVEQQKRHLIAELNALKTNQAFQTKKLFLQALFERTKYHVPIDVRTKNISNITAADVQSFHNKWIKSSQDTFVTMETPSLEAASTLGVFPANNQRQRPHSLVAQKELRQNKK